MAASVQHYPLPLDVSAPDLAALYFTWLSSRFLGLVAARPDAAGARVIRFLGVPLIRLHPTVLDDEHARYEVRGGLLARTRGVFSFRVEARVATVALTDYGTRLPRFLYAITQAPLHALVMNRFGRYLVKRPAALPPRGGT